MSNNTSTTNDGTANTGSTTGSTITLTTPASSTTDTAAEVEKWKAMARKHEADAAKALRELDAARASTQTEAEKAAERDRKNEERIAALELRGLRRDIALEHKLTTDDAALLDNVTDEAAMRTLATRLAGDAARKNSNTVTREGRTPGQTGTDPVRELTRELFS